MLTSAEFTATTTYTAAQYHLVLYGFVVALFALFATGLYGASTRNEVARQYRGAAVASTAICWVASLAYLALLLEWVLGFTASADGSTYTPDPGTVVTELRYMDWSVTVPMLVCELLAVAVLTRAQALRWRTVGIASAFLMIATGYLGVVYGAGGGSTTAALWVWGAISTVFFVVLYVVAWQAYRATAPAVGDEARTSYRNALVLLFSVFGAYPLAYLVPVWASSNPGAWGTTEQLVFTFADIAAKAGFGVLIHKVAKLRTAEDARRAGGGADEAVASTAPDSVAGVVWISGELVSTPRLVSAEAPVGAGAGAPSANGHRQTRR
ncbi:bacteriorhodopsin [Quadrisphaera setariae]|uniref:Rhodopsin n=1 Tax=Quadrisphaera setariae TaxID=2593304 RepID=A0A5C8ZLK0_9ACTN|nr:bacteriorhodopsin [Quadrisphaera setariae]TXR58019.1 rhodopsin [Quadrisphaera setariae]